MTNCSMEHDHIHAVHDGARDTQARLHEIEQVCVHKNLRLTPLRKQVLALILNAQQPIGAYDLLAHLGKQGKPAAPPTVYRSLDFLLEQGFIHRLASINAFIPCCHPRAGHQAAFLICTQCHRVQESSVNELMQAVEHVAAQGRFMPQHSLIEISGLCEHCQS